jgi:hypothetical protein
VRLRKAFCFFFLPTYDPAGIGLNIFINFLIFQSLLISADDANPLFLFNLIGN